MTVGDTLVCDDAQGHDLLFLYGFAVLFDPSLRLPHGNKYSRSAEFIKVVVDGVGPYGSQICYEKACMERTGVYNGKRQSEILVDKFKHAYCGTYKERNPYKACHQFIQRVLGCRLLRALDSLLNFPVYCENIIVQVEVQLVYRIACLARLQCHEGHAEVIACIDFSVHYKPVEKRVLRCYSQSSGDDNAHMAHVYAFFAAFSYIILH